MTPDARGERPMTNAELDEAISRAANRTSFAGLLAARGEATVVMDQDGAMIRRHPESS